MAIAASKRTGSAALVNHNPLTVDGGLLMTEPPTWDFPHIMPGWGGRAPWAVSRPATLVGLRDELGRRVSFYPRLIAKGRMTEVDAARHIAVLQDVLDRFAWYDSSAPAGKAPRDLTFSWSEQVNELRRELYMQAGSFPRWIRSGKLDAADAKMRADFIAAAHWQLFTDPWLMDRATIDALAPLATAEDHKLAQRYRDHQEVWRCRWRQLVAIWRQERQRVIETYQDRAAA